MLWRPRGVPACLHSKYLEVAGKTFSLCDDLGVIAIAEICPASQGADGVPWFASKDSEMAQHLQDITPDLSLQQIAQNIIQSPRLASPIHMVSNFLANVDPAMHASADVIFRDRGQGADGQESPQEWRQILILVRSAIKKVHETHSHAPYKESLARYLQHALARRLAVDAARLFVCKHCEQRQRLRSRPAAAIPLYKHFNAAISMDFMIIPDVKKKMYCVLVIVHVASDFTAARCVCAGPHPNSAAARSAFEKAWLAWAGPPLFGIISDLDTAFMKEFQELINDLGIK